MSLAHSRALLVWPEATRSTTAAEWRQTSRNTKENGNEICVSFSFMFSLQMCPRDSHTSLAASPPTWKRSTADGMWALSRTSPNPEICGCISSTKSERRKKKEHVWFLCFPRNSRVHRVYQKDVQKKWKKYTFLNIKFSMFVSILPVKIYRNLNRTLYSRLTFFKVYLTNLKLITATIEQQLYVNTWGTRSVISTGGWSLWWFITGRGCTEPAVQQVCKATEPLGFILFINPNNAATLSLIPMPRFWLDLVYTVFFFFFFHRSPLASPLDWSECPHYTTDRPNECFFNETYTSVWTYYSVQLRSRDGYVLYDEDFFNVQDIGKFNPGSKNLYLSINIKTY